MAQKKSLKFFVYASIGIISAGLLSTGVYFFISAQKPKNGVPDQNLGPRLLYQNEANWPPDLKIEQYPYKINRSTGKPLYYFTEQEVREIINRFLESANYGPEIFNLKRIAINDFNLENDDASGIYYPTTNEIGIYATPNANTSSKLESIKVEKISQILFHEYGHHLFYSYVSSPFPKIINSENGQRENYYKIELPNNFVNYINLEFWNWFKDIFAYNSNQIQPSQNIPSLKHPMISTKLSLKENFDEANDETKNEDQNSYSILYPNKEHKIDNRVGINNSYIQSNGEGLEYLYSIEELLTRKYQLSTMTYPDELKYLLNPEHFSGLGVKRISNVMFEDYLSYASLYYDPNYFARNDVSDQQWANALDKVGTNKQPDFFEEVLFYEDNPFRTINDGQQTMTIAQDFAQHMANYMGAEDERDLSNIFAKNTWEFKSGYLVRPSQWNINEGNQIKLSGYLNDEIKNQITNKNVYLATKNEDSFIKHSLISLHENSINYKESVFNDQSITLPNTSSSFWITNDYIDAENIENQPLYFVWENDQGKEESYKFKSYRGQGELANEEGFASTWLENYPTMSAQDIYNKNIKIWGGTSLTNQDQEVIGVGIKSYGKYYEGYPNSKTLTTKIAND